MVLVVLVVRVNLELEQFNFRQYLVSFVNLLLPIERIDKFF